MRLILPRITPCALLAFALCMRAQTADPLLHQPAPEFVRSGLNHERIDLSAYRGKVVLLNFWATWCAPCQTEMPRLVRWQRRYRKAGLQVIGISMDDDADQAGTLVRRRRLNYPVLMGDSDLGTQYGEVLGLPVTFLIDRQGRIAAHFKGETSMTVMRREMERLLREKGE
ncbi:MAG TPA: TlpA disulfide reductase family protein [Terracidiphilus sp.]|jgi:peroxiredoxin